MCWAYLARSKPRAKREVVPGVVAFRCDLAVKDMLILTGPDRFFDDDHYRGYPAILGRLKLLEANEVEYLMWWAWRAQAPKSLQKSLHKGVA
ncbi:MAG: hypothetical protein EBR82_35585 [Caulobacteraceae bacterium]|nr:hypothetical protein [Caulobacteraceae bacterium]